MAEKLVHTHAGGRGSVDVVAGSGGVDADRAPGVGLTAGLEWGAIEGPLVVDVVLDEFLGETTEAFVVGLSMGRVWVCPGEWESPSGE